VDDGLLASESDADLVHAALDGQRDAFAVLVSRRWKAAAVLAVKTLGSADLGREAAQEATIAAMEGLDQLRSADRFGAWFCGITLNVAQRWLREARAEIPVLSAEPSSNDPGPAEAAGLADLAATVRAAVTQFPVGSATRSCCSTCKALPTGKWPPSWASR